MVTVSSLTGAKLSVKNQVFTCCSCRECRVGYRNRFHHPDPGVFERDLGRHIELTRSDAGGAVQIRAAGVRAEGIVVQGTPAPRATLTPQRYRTAHHRYWMDR